MVIAEKAEFQLPNDSYEDVNLLVCVKDFGMHIVNKTERATYWAWHRND